MLEKRSLQLSSSLPFLGESDSFLCSTDLRFKTSEFVVTSFIKLLNLKNFLRRCYRGEKFGFEAWLTTITGDLWKCKASMYTWFCKTFSFNQRYPQSRYSLFSCVFFSSFVCVCMFMYVCVHVRACACVCAGMGLCTHLIGMCVAGMKWLISVLPYWSLWGCYWTG